MEVRSVREVQGRKWDKHVQIRGHGVGEAQVESFLMDRYLPMCVLFEKMYVSK